MIDADAVRLLCRPPGRLADIRRDRHHSDRPIPIA
jgi:hypothetical protein